MRTYWRMRGRVIRQLCFRERIRSAAMASGRKSALLSSLADYGDDSEPDSEPDIEETGKICYNLLFS